MFLTLRSCSLYDVTQHLNHLLAFYEFLKRIGAIFRTCLCMTFFLSHIITMLLAHQLLHLFLFLSFSLYISYIYTRFALSNRTHLHMNHFSWYSCYSLQQLCWMSFQLMTITTDFKTILAWYIKKGSFLKDCWHMVAL